MCAKDKQLLRTWTLQWRAWHLLSQLQQASTDLLTTTLETMEFLESRSNIPLYCLTPARLQDPSGYIPI